MDITFQPSVDAFKRVGLPNILDKFGVSGGMGWNDMDDLQKKIARIYQSPRERFMLTINALSLHLAEQNIIPQLSLEDLTVLFTKVDSLKQIEHMNPQAYILGYVVTDQSTTNRVINRNNIINMFNLLPSIEGGVTPPDLVRYARLWEHL